MVMHLTPEESDGSSGETRKMESEPEDKNGKQSLTGSKKKHKVHFNEG
jgi:hypothetical protein